MKLWKQFDTAWASHLAEVLGMTSLAQAPMNTDDDLKLLLSVHRYQVAYDVAGNFGCKPQFH